MKLIGIAHNIMVLMIADFPPEQQLKQITELVGDYVKSPANKTIGNLTHLANELDFASCMIASSAQTPFLQHVRLLRDKVRESVEELMCEQLLMNKGPKSVTEFNQVRAQLTRMIRIRDQFLDYLKVDIVLDETADISYSQAGQQFSRILQSIDSAVLWEKFRLLPLETFESLRLLFPETVTNIRNNLAKEICGLAKTPAGVNSDIVAQMMNRLPLHMQALLVSSSELPITLEVSYIHNLFKKIA